jgi:hypothetical protein
MYKIDQTGEWHAFGAEYKNAHGFTAMVWDCLIRKYEVKTLREQPYFSPQGPLREAISAFKPDTPMSPYADWELLWHLATNELLPLKPWEQNVLRATYDRVAVEAANFETFARSLELFGEALIPSNLVNHLPQMAKDVRKLIGDEEVIGICWYPMSVSTNLWTHYNEDTDETTYYNFLQGQDHHFAKIEAFDV